MADVINVNLFNGGGGGTTDYTNLTNKPRINNVILQGNQTAQDLSLEPASQACFGRFWNESLSQSKATGYIGSLDFGKNLVAKLGLGRYLVTDDRRYMKLHPEDSNKDIAGNPVLLDGSQGQCMWCWNEFYYGSWQQTISGDVYTYEIISLLPTYQNHQLMRVPRGGVSWLSAGVWDAANSKLCSLISDDPNYRGGRGNALTSNFAPQCSADMKQRSMLGMPCIKSPTDSGTAARRRGTGWEANWFVARAAVEILIRIYFGNRNSRAAVNANTDVNGLPQGGLGVGVSRWSVTEWANYNTQSPLIPNSFSIKDSNNNPIGDFTGEKIYDIVDKDNNVVYSAKVPFFFGLMNPFGHLLQGVRGLMVNIETEGVSKIYVTPSMAKTYNPDTITDKLFVGNMVRERGYIKKIITDKFAMVPSKVGGSSSTYYCSYIEQNYISYPGLKRRAAGGCSHSSSSGMCFSTFLYSESQTGDYNTVPLCVFSDDPQVD